MDVSKISYYSYENVGQGKHHNIDDIDFGRQNYQDFKN